MATRKRALISKTGLGSALLAGVCFGVLSPIYGPLCAADSTSARKSRSDPAAKQRWASEHQTTSTNRPPISPDRFDPDPAANPVRKRGEAAPRAGELRRSPRDGTAPNVRPAPAFNPDPGTPPVRPRPQSIQPPSLRFERTESGPGSANRRYDSDPGPATGNPEVERLLKNPFQRYLAPPRGATRLIDKPLRRAEFLQTRPEAPEISEPIIRPSGSLRRPSETLREPVKEGLTWSIPEIPDGMQLPREQSVSRLRIPFDHPHPHYYESPEEASLPPYAEPVQDRWRIGFTPWKRYTSGVAETPYAAGGPRLWHPYKQSLLKGDLPIIGQDIFLNLTASSQTEIEFRRVPTPSGISAAQPGGSEFYGRNEQFFLINNLGLQVDLFRGETAFKPFEWAVRLQPVINVNYIRARETGVVSPDPRGFLGGGNNTAPPDNRFVETPADVDNLLDGVILPLGPDLSGRRHTTRLKEFYALQQAFVELHLRDLSSNYDFIATRIGNQPFNSDFRGFIFNDINLGARVFGNALNNRLQYNLAVFDMREKDTNSELNSFNQRGQRVVVANAYYQDLIWKGYTAQLSFHANFDDANLHYDRNGLIVRPAPIGDIRPHNVRAYYLGWTGEGHIKRLNISHSFYQVFGHDEFNGLAGRRTEINAQMAALELSYDRDWIRYAASVFYASGDGDAADGQANGFDNILDNPNFTGGPFSYYVRQGFNLGGSFVNFKQRQSLVPNLRSNKGQGQANFVNPGVLLLGVGSEIEVTPKLRSFVNANYIRMVEADPIRRALTADNIDEEIGFDLSLGFQYRPFLTDNVIISTGFGALIPGAGFRDIYRRSSQPAAGFTGASDAGRTDSFFYSALFAINLTY